MEIKTTNEIISNHLKSKKYSDLNQKWVSVEELQEVINELTLTGYRGNPEGYINVKHLLDRLKGEQDEML